MESSTIVTLLLVVGLGGLALWYLNQGAAVTSGGATVPATPCSSTGEQIAGGAISVVGKVYAKTNTTPTQACVGITAAAKSTAKATANFLADHTTIKTTVLFVPNSIYQTSVKPLAIVAHPVDTGKGIYGAAKSAIGQLF